MNALVVTSQSASGNPYAFLTRRAAHAPLGTDFTACLTVWQQGRGGLCQTNLQLADRIGLYLHAMHVSMCREKKSDVSPSPWIVMAMPVSQGPPPHPLQIEISCKTADFWKSEPSNEEDRRQRCRNLIDELLWKHLQAISHHKDIKKVFSSLIGFVLKHPAVPNDGDEVYCKLHVQCFHVPELEQWQRWEKEMIKTKFYHGPLLALDQIADTFLAYGPLIQIIPTQCVDSPPVIGAIRVLKSASVVMPNIKARIPQLVDLDRSSVHDLIHECYPSVLRSMEDALEALEELAVATRSEEPCPRKTCNAICRMYLLKRETPKLTAVLAYLSDKKKQAMFKWGSIALGGAVIVGAAFGPICLAPAVAANASGSLLMGTQTAGAVVTSGKMGLSSVVFRTAASRLGQGLLGSGSVMTIGAFLKQVEAEQVKCINSEINDSIEEVMYYLALCFLKSNGVAHPREAKDELEEILQKMYGRRPSKLPRSYRAVYLHWLVRKIMLDFQAVTDLLRDVGYSRLEYLKWRLKSVITEEESTMVI